MHEEQEPREIVMLQKFQPGHSASTRDFRPVVQKVPDEEIKEVEETITPAPKDESARGSADSKLVVSTPTVPTSLGAQPENPVPTELSPTELLEAAVAASGSDSSSSEDEPPLPTEVVQTPSDDDSSQSFSTETSPGKSEPPASAPPPPAAPSLPPTPPPTSQ